MNDSDERNGRQSDPRQEDLPLSALAATLRRFGGPDLDCCCSLALLVRELSGDRRCRVEVTCDRSGATGGPDAPDRAATDEGGPGGHRIPVRAPGAPGVPEAWLVVDRRGGERALPDLDRLSPIATLAGLALARRRLAREARRARRDAKEIRGVLDHALRGHLHTVLLRTDSLLLDLPEEGDPKSAVVRRQLEDLKDTVLRMVEEIREVVEAPDARDEPPSRSADGSRKDLRIADLVREALEMEWADKAAPRLDVEGEIPPVRADPRQLGPALGELLDLVRRSRRTATLSVRPEASPSGVRIELSVELEPFTGTGAKEDEPATHAGASPVGARRDGREGPNGEKREEERPSLRDVVGRLGGRLRVEADDRTRATVVVSLPAGEGD